ncbi:hypothetical protein ACFL60_07995 [Candidatus Omnitrophota bacterium]
MNRSFYGVIILLAACLIPTHGSEAADMDDVLRALNKEVSGNRSRDYTMRLWQYDKWSSLPMWNKTANEARTIMNERDFDEARIVDTPADGVTRYGTWTNPIGWDCKQGTLEVIEPKGLPDEYRYLCNYRDNPTSLNNYSCPTPPDGVEAELVLLEQSSQKEMEKLDVRGKIILVSSGSRAMKRHLDPNGALGIVSDEIEGNSADFVTANNWLNGWSDMPGGWQMNGNDSKNNFGFAISQRKGNYLRGLLRRGVTVKVRAKIDSRYYTDGSLQYVVGSIKGKEQSDEDVLVVSHIYEWGANDDCTGASIDLEALGTLNDLITSGELDRPRRSIRMWLGFELYGSMAYTMHNLDRMRNKTLAVLCCDSPAMDYDLAITNLRISSNFNACPSFTDAVFPELVGKYYDRYAQTRNWKQLGFMGGLDNFFGDPMIGVPINAMYLSSNAFLHHNSMDTIEKVDPRSLREQAIINAAYLYYLADAGEDEIPFITQLTFDRALGAIREKTAAARETAMRTADGESLGKALAEGIRTIDYYTTLQKDTLESIKRLVTTDKREALVKSLETYKKQVDEFSGMMKDHFRIEVDRKSKKDSIKIVSWKKPVSDWDREAEKIIPKRKYVGTMTLEGIPHEKWVEVSGSPRWWSAGSVPAASYFWCDGKRNLKEIRDLVELESGRSVGGFDLIKYYRFLEEHDMVEFVK